ncbi:MAG: class I SAM-dependent methyltransferase [Erythrobacter sp.]|uniref:SAM-dependent methyltransferase n=1 Tax=Erythrobacter sp. TaxID=1042 RepID=UPI00261A03FE|nr:class I SAM-dependent methyltransferase [Erythrobacter sp.]MDJ0979101.1 class I SAM-dependent methyltransferase [Erythrobacter sp.]
MIKSFLNRFKDRAPAALSESDTTHPEPTLWQPVSQSCTQNQFLEPHYSRWCGAIREEPRRHRKQWEFCYILQALKTRGMMTEGKRALGFGVGQEPLAALFASHGVSVLATDLEPAEAADAGWVETAQHAQSKEALNERGICDPESFDKLVEFRFMDMNAIAPELDGHFDFCWSACAFEHLGSIAQGLEFVMNSVRCLKPGGVAVHTTEFNCTSNTDTLDNNSTVLFRKRDLLWLQQRLAEQGASMELNFNLGEQPLDKHVDVPPYSRDPHLKLQFENWITTSFGLIVRKSPLTDDEAASAATHGQTKAET